jgi:predicted O-methyltransferase YrrM
MGYIVPDAVERYLSGLNRAHDTVLDDIARAGDAQGLPLVDAEVGAIWLAGALPADGMLITMEKDPERAAIAKTNFERAGLSDRVSIMVGDAALKIVKVAGPFDLIFQDGHKPLYNTLLDPLVRLLRPGGLLVTDNVLWDGEVVPGFIDRPRRDDEDTRAIAEYNQRLSTYPQLLTAIVPLRDGVAISVKQSQRTR